METNKQTTKEITMIKHLIDEVKTIIDVRHSNIAEEIMEMSFECGEAIANSPLYKKGHDKLLNLLVKDVKKLNRDTLEKCVLAYKKWGDAEKCREDLRKKLKKPQIMWSEVTKNLTQ